MELVLRGYIPDATVAQFYSEFKRTASVVPHAQGDSVTTRIMLLYVSDNFSSKTCLLSPQDKSLR